MSRINEIIGGSQGGDGQGKNEDDLPPIGRKYLKLIDAVPPNKTCSRRQAYVWAFDNSVNRISEIDKTKIPSRPAIRLLEQAQRNFDVFMADYKSAVMEKGAAEAAAEDAMRARQLSGHLEKWMDEFKKAEAKDANGS